MKMRFFEKTKRKLSSRLGFSLVESMVCMLVVGLVSVSMVTGIQCSVHAYQKVIDEANGRVLLSTAMTMLRNELSTAEITSSGENGQPIQYRNADGELWTLGIVGGTEEIGYYTINTQDPVTGAWTTSRRAKITYQGGTAKLCRGKKDADALNNAEDAASLVDPTTATGGMQVTYSDVTLDGKLLTFTDLHVYLPEADGKTEKKVVAAVETFCVRTQ